MMSMNIDPTEMFTLGSTSYSLGIGVILGFALKKLFKVFLFLLGAYIASIMYLAQKGIIIVNQTKLEESIQSAVHTVSTEVFQMGYALANTAGFAVGFLAGWKMA